MILKIQSILELVKKRSRLPGFKGYYRQLFEICVLLIIRRIGPGYYHLAEMGKNDYSWRYMFSFANAHEYHNAVLRVNHPMYHKVSQHKAVEKAIFCTFGVPTAPLIGFFNSTTGLDVSGRPLKTIRDLRELLGRSINKVICFKPAEGFGGIGFCAFKVLNKDGEIFLLKIGTQKLLTIDALFLKISSPEGFVVEEYIEQDHDFAKYHSNSVNTVRVLVFRGKDNTTRCIGMTFRMGQGGAIVDNATTGGIMANVNVKTGIMDAGVFMKPSEHYLSNHPTSNEKLKGCKLSHYDEIQVLACRTLDAFPNINFAGFDIALSVDGPIVVELNPKPDYVFMAINKLPSRYIFNKF